jgi:O-antigen/teichoic acid export membrane protein
MDREPVLKNIARYFSSSMYQSIFGVINAFIKAKFLTPELLGLWSLLSIIPEYSSCSDLGSRTSMKYLIPYYEGKGEFQKNDEIKGAVFYGTLYASLIIAGILVLLSFKEEFDLKLRLGLLTVALIVLLGWHSSYYCTLLKAYQKFRILTLAFYLKTTAAFFLNVLLIYFFKIYGLYLSAILSLIIFNTYMRAKYPLKRSNPFQFRVYKGLFKKGFPLLVFSLGVLFITTSDRFIISYFLGNEQLGYYSIAIMVFSFFLSAPDSVREVIEPRMMENMGKSSKEDSLEKYFFKPLINISYFLPFLVGPVIFIFPVAVRLILPRYTDGILPTQIVIIGGYFLAVSYTTRGIIVARNLQIKALMIMILSIPVNIGLSIYFIKLGMGIKGVAIGTGISYFIFFISLLIFVRVKCNYAPKDWNSAISCICWPFPVMCITILFLLKMSGMLPLNEYLTAFANLFIYSLIMLFVTNLSARRYVLLKSIRPGKLLKYI